MNTESVRTGSYRSFPVRGPLPVPVLDDAGRRPTMNMRRKYPFTGKASRPCWPRGTSPSVSNRRQGSSSAALPGAIRPAPFCEGRALPDFAKWTKRREVRRQGRKAREPGKV